MGPPAAGLRPLLRQTALRPAGPRGRRIRPRPPRRRPRFPAPARPLPGEPRRTPGRRHPARRTGTRGSRGRRDPARRDPLARGPVRRTPGPSARVPLTSASGTGRRVPARLLRPSGERRGPRPRRRLAAADLHGLAGQRQPRQPARLVLDRRPGTATRRDQLLGPARPGQVPLPWTDFRGQSCELTELLSGNTYEREGDELVDPGLFVALDAWHWHLLSLRR